MTIGNIQPAPDSPARRTLQVAVGAVILIVTCISVYGQQLMEFDSASVKRSAPGTDRTGIFVIGPQDFSADGAPIGMLIGHAYGLSRYEQPEGLPEWAKTERYDIRAKAGRPATPDERRAMLRTLLQERFGVVAHMKSRQVDVLALSVVERPNAPPRGLERVTCPSPPMVGRDTASLRRVRWFRRDQINGNTAVRLGQPARSHPAPSRHR